MRPMFYYTCTFSISEDRKVCGTEKKCVLIEVKCYTVTSFLDLWKKSNSGVLTIQFRPVLEELRRQTGNSQLQMRVFMYSNEAVACLESIGNKRVKV